MLHQDGYVHTKQYKWTVFKDYLDKFVKIIYLDDIIIYS